MRRFLTTEMGHLDHGGMLAQNIQAMRAACRKFLDRMQGVEDRPLALPTSSIIHMGGFCISPQKGAWFRYVLTVQARLGRLPRANFRSTSRELSTHFQAQNEPCPKRCIKELGQVAGVSKPLRCRETGILRRFLRRGMAGVSQGVPYETSLSTAESWNRPTVCPSRRRKEPTAPFWGDMQKPPYEVVRGVGLLRRFRGNARGVRTPHRADRRAQRVRHRGRTGEHSSGRSRRRR